MEELFDRRIVAGAGHAEGIVERGEERVEAKQKPGLIEAGLSQTSRSKDAARLVLPEDGGRLSKSLTQNAAIRCIRGVFLALPARETMKISPVWT